MVKETYTIYLNDKQLEWIKEHLANEIVKSCLDERTYSKYDKGIVERRKELIDVYVQFIG